MISFWYCYLLFCLFCADQERLTFETTLACWILKTTNPVTGVPIADAVKVFIGRGRPIMLGFNRWMKDWFGNHREGGQGLWRRYL